jgi:hypothetical protein
MKHVIIFFIFLVPSLAIYSQGGMKKKYFLGNGFSSFTSNAIESPNGGYVVVGVTTDTLKNKNISRLTVIGTDSQMNLIWRKDYGGLNNIYADNLFAGPETGYHDSTFIYCVYTVSDTSKAKQRACLIKFDYNGDTIWQRTYTISSPRDLVPQGMCRSVDGGFLITGMSQEWVANTQAAFVIKTNNEGKELWRKLYSKPYPDVQDGKSIIQDKISKKIVTVGFQYLLQGGDFVVQSNILVSDSIGNFLFRKSYNNDNGGGFAQIIQLKDGNFLTGGGWCDHFGIKLIYTKAMAVKFDIDGNIIWKKEYGPVARGNLLGYFNEKANGEISAFGSNGVLWDKLDMLQLSSKGDLLFQREIGTGVVNNEEFLKSIHRTKDNGLLISTTFYQSKTPVPFSIIKIDSVGCDTTEEYCQVLAGVEEPVEKGNAEIKIFPNPGSDHISIQFPGSTNQFKRIIITDVTNRILEEVSVSGEQALLIETSGYPEGIYFVSFYYTGTLIETRKLVISR